MSGEPTPELSAALRRIEELEEQIRDLKSALGQDDPTISITFKLSASLSNALGLLMARIVVPGEMLSQSLGIATDSKVLINRLRNEMKDYGVKIEGRRNVGYWLDEDTKAKVRGMIHSQMNPQVTPKVTEDPKIAVA